MQWLADAVGLIPDEAAPAADRHALLAAASAIAAHGQSADSSKCAPARARPQCILGAGMHDMVCTAMVF